MGREARRQTRCGRPHAQEGQRRHYPEHVPDGAAFEHDHLVEISWDEFFKEFDERKLALLYEPNSMFSKLVGRDSVKER